LFLLYALKLDPELLIDEATAAFQLADGLHEENNEETAQQKQKREKERNKARRRVASELLSRNDCPVKLELITGHRFLRYLLSLRNSRTNSCLSHASYQAKRAALFHLFRSFNVRQPDDLQNQLKTAMKGVRRMVAVEKQNGDGRIQVGMEPMTFTLYNFWRGNVWRWAKQMAFLALLFLYCLGIWHAAQKTLAQSN